MRVQELAVVDDSVAKILWNLYSTAMSALEEKTPYRQMLGQDKFMAAMSDPIFRKILLYTEDVPIGLVLVAGDINAVGEWLSVRFFEKHYSGQEVQFLVGLVVSPSLTGLRAGKGGIMLMEAAFKGLPDNAIFCLDHSQNLHRSYSRNCSHLAQRTGHIVCAQELLSFAAFRKENMTS